MIKCCYKCEKRYPGCHSKCEDYAAEKEQYTTDNRTLLGKIAVKEYYLDKRKRLSKKR